MSDLDNEQDKVSKSYATLRKRELLMKFDTLFYRLELVCKDLEGHSHNLRHAYKFAANKFRVEMNEIRKEVDQIRYIRVS